jgi:anthranilate synthase/aminodeoxychorismate synthase-like glutamine amidotransferase
VLIVDNYDSFTFNLVQLLGTLGADCTVLLNDACDPETVRRLEPQAILLSPGPCTPAEAGFTLALLTEFAGVLPILGVCLGHQAIAHHFGGRLQRANPLLHGQSCPIEHDGLGIFAGLPTPFLAARYNSLAVAEEDFPAPLRVTARSPGGEIMALRHSELEIVGVQFHPESILSECGPALMGNWLRTIR